MSAQRDLQYLDHISADRITKKVFWFCGQPNPMRHAERLTSPYQDIYRFQIGDYRALFKKTDRGELIILMILRVKHRREAYR